MGNRLSRALAVAVSAAFAAGAFANQLPIFIGSTYDPATSTGLRNVHASSIRNDGTALGEGSNYVNSSSRGVRSQWWNASGTVATLSFAAQANSSGAGNAFFGNDGQIYGRTIYSTHASTITRWETPSQPSLFQIAYNGQDFTLNTPRAANKAGVVVGDAYAEPNGYQGYRPIVWQPDGSFQELGILTPGAGNYSETRAFLVNDSGLILGNGTLFTPEGVRLGDRPIRWDSQGNAHAMEVTGAGPNGYLAADVAALNNNGVSVGTINVQSQLGAVSTSSIPARWDAQGNLTQLESPVLTSDGKPNSAVVAINASNVAVGNTILPGGQPSLYNTRAVRWDANGHATVLPSINTSATGYGQAVAQVINSMGVAAGSSAKFVSGQNIGDCAAVWLADGTIIDLNDRYAPSTGWSQLSRVTAISDTGWVAGAAYYTASGIHDYNSMRLFSMLVPQAGTYGKGDANFDTKTDFDDLVILAQHYNESNTSQKTNVADFDLSGVVDFNDLVALAQNYGAGTANLSGFDSSFAADWTLAQSLVPEPASFAAVGGIAMLRRRRRVSGDR